MSRARKRQYAVRARYFSLGVKIHLKHEIVVEQASKIQIHFSYLIFIWDNKSMHIFYEIPKSMTFSYDVDERNNYPYDHFTSPTISRT